ncbi:MAG: hypothetical protein MJ025_02800, partial [Victivallaceae bacterium]|nr:hypothetical protein [Victivallaceae bacterium]
GDDEPVVIKLPRPQAVALTAFAENIYGANADPDKQARFCWNGDALAIDYEFPVANNLVIPFHAVVAPTVDKSKLMLRIDCMRAGLIVLPVKYCQGLVDSGLEDLEKDPDYREAIETVSSLSWSEDGNTLTIVLPPDVALKLVKLIAGF